MGRRGISSALAVLLAACGASPPSAPRAPSDADLDEIADTRDVCPEHPEDRDLFRDEDGCPEPDNDEDHVADVDDLCPCEAEDGDGFEDADGCPDLDDDGDRLLDACDRCPREGEVYNGFCDEDGCPDRGHVLLVDETITILDRAPFAQGSSRLTDDVGPLIDALAHTLLQHPEIELVAVVGHAGRRERSREALARARAEAVHAALIGRGVPTERLVLEVSLALEDEGDVARARTVGFEIRRLNGLEYRDGRPVEGSPVGPPDCAPVPDCAALSQRTSAC
jgi:outer membrane protein OmpA-like peptidoglycan-associated protein